MRAHRVETTVNREGSIAIDGLPIHVGERVEVILLVADTRAAPARHSAPGYPLRGKEPYRYEDPFAPVVPPEEWEANA